jgi:hypothetical protein
LTVLRLSLRDAVRRAPHAMPARKDARQRHVAGLAKFETAFEQRIAEGVGLQRPDVTADELAPQAQPFARSDIGGGNDSQIVLQVPAPSLASRLATGPLRIHQRRSICCAASAASCRSSLWGKNAAARRR